MELFHLRPLVTYGFQIIDFNEPRTLYRITQMLTTDWSAKVQTMKDPFVFSTTLKYRPQKQKERNFI
jgi:hypothetical protein